MVKNGLKNIPSNFRAKKIRRAGTKPARLNRIHIHGF